MQVSIEQLREQVRASARSMAIHYDELGDPADFAEFIALWTLTQVQIEQHDRTYFSRLERRYREANTRGDRT